MGLPEVDQLDGRTFVFWARRKEHMEVNSYHFGMVRDTSQTIGGGTTATADVFKNDATRFHAAPSPLGKSAKTKKIAQ